MENKVYDLVKRNASGKCKRLMRHNALYIEFEFEEELDHLMSSDFSSEKLLRDNNISIDPEMKSIEELTPILNKSFSTSEEKTMSKLEKSPLNKLTKNFDERCIDALKGARFTTRIKPPNDFFEAYTNPSLCILFFLMCLCIVLVNKIEETVRSD